MKQKANKLSEKGGRRSATAKLRPGQLERAKQLYAAKQNTIAEIKKIDITADRG